MKKILTLALIFATTITAYGQETTNKRVQAGLTVGGAMSFNTPQTNTMKSKVGGVFLAGMTLDWNFAQNVGLTTGIEFEFDRFKSFYNNPTFYEYDDKDIKRFKDIEESKAYQSFLLEERKHNSIYLTIPVMLKFQSNYVGYFRYFGRFGVRNSFNLMTRATDKGKDFAASGAFNPDINELKDMHTKGTLAFYKGAVGITGGAEYNITGSTVLVAEIGYFYGFSNIFNQGLKNSWSLFNRDEFGMKPTVKEEYYQPSLKEGQLMLKVSVLF